MSFMEKKVKGLQDCVSRMFSENKVDLIVGYSKGSNNVRTIPYFINNIKDAGKLTFNSFCINNLTLYLNELKDKRVGVVVKGCDSKHIVELIRGNQVKRENLQIVGLSCGGMIDPLKLPRDYDPNRDEITEDGENVIINKTRKIPKKNLYYDKCVECATHTPVVYDHLIGDRTEEPEEPATDPYSKARKIEEMALEERRKYWVREFDKCIRCTACRNICALCYCRSCALDSKNGWVSKANKDTEKWMYHMIKAYHTTVRCVRCGECERVCPMGVRLMTLNRKIEKEVKELFGYEAGLDVEGKSPLSVYSVEDGEF